jgi:hypothetical protein
MEGEKIYLALLVVYNVVYTYMKTNLSAMPRLRASRADSLLKLAVAL